MKYAHEFPIFTKYILIFHHIKWRTFYPFYSVVIYSSWSVAHTYTFILFKHNLNDLYRPVHLGIFRLQSAHTQRRKILQHCKMYAMGNLYRTKLLKS